MQTPIVICFAVTHEAKPFHRLVRGRSDIQLTYTGIGHCNAEKSIRSILQQFRPRLVISSGFAGALDPTLAVGTVLFDADPNSEWSRRLIAAGARPGKFHCSESIVISAKSKSELRRSIGADAIDMESSAIREVCRGSNIPSATVRVISDAADEDLPIDFNRCMTRDWRLDYLKLFALILQSPRSVGNLISFQKRLEFARQKLSDALGALWP